MTPNRNSFESIFGMQVWRKRVKAHMTQAELAEKIGLTKAQKGKQISRIENYQGVQLEPALRIALALDIDLMEIARAVYGRDGSRNPYAYTDGGEKR